MIPKRNVNLAILSASEDRFFIRDFFVFVQEESGCTYFGIDIRKCYLPQA
jgi:hypothetical protein